MGFLKPPKKEPGITFLTVLASRYLQGMRTERCGGSSRSVWRVRLLRDRSKPRARRQPSVEPSGRTWADIRPHTDQSQSSSASEQGQICGQWLERRQKWKIVVTLAKLSIVAGAHKYAVFVIDATSGVRFWTTVRPRQPEGTAYRALHLRSTEKTFKTKRNVASASMPGYVFKIQSDGLLLVNRLHLIMTNVHSTKMGKSLTSGFWSFVCNWWWFSRKVLDRWDQCSLEAWNSIKWWANEIRMQVQIFMDY